MSVAEKEALSSKELESILKQNDSPNPAARAKRIRDDLMRMKGELTALSLEAKESNLDLLAYLLSVAILEAHEAAEEESPGRPVQA